jgi:ribosomal protein S18 acetylase RimI-like enzyme
MKILLLKNKFLLKDKNKNIGYLKFEYPSDASLERNIEIPYMYVMPEYRRQGFAKKLLNHALDYFKKRKIVWVSLWTGKDLEQKKAYPLYRKLGFKEIAHQEDYYEKGVGVRLFVKRLNK